jgi:hypothetical protein
MKELLTEPVMRTGFLEMVMETGIIRVVYQQTKD